MLVCMPCYVSPARFFCSTVPLKGTGFFCCIFAFFNFDSLNFSVSAILGSSDMVAEEAELGWEQGESDLLSGLRWLSAKRNFF